MSVLVAGLSGCVGLVSTPKNLVSPTPSITSQPVNQMVTTGQTATFTVQATGTVPMSYEWYRNGTAISSGTSYSGSYSYTTPAATTADNGARFTVVVTNIAGTATSAPAVLTVTFSPTAPSITSQPASQTVTLGQTATFSVSATGTNPLSYQWYRNGAAIAAATSTSYTIPATISADGGAQFTVVVSNTAGSVTSNPATLTVNAAPVAPSITTQPANQTVMTGRTATFSVAATGTGPMNYQWNRNGAAISGATSSSYTTAATTSSDNGAQFAVVVSNTAGSVTSNAATLTVNPAPVAPSITTQPASQTVTAGLTATFSIVAAGTTPLNYQWNKNGTAISGATSSSYTTAATTSSDNGAQFTVVVSNTAGSVTSNAATLTVNPAPAQVAAIPSSAAFGSVITGTSNSQTITLINSGGSTATISQAIVSGAGFSTTLVVPLTIAAGGNATFNVVFAPTAAGAVTGSVSLLSNALGSPLVIPLGGTGVVPTFLLGANPTSLSFGNVNVGASGSLSTVLTNNGNSNVTISSIITTGAGFSVTGVTTGTTLIANQSVILSVSFVPMVAGSVTGSVTVLSNATNSPLVVAVAGTGLSATWPLTLVTPNLPIGQVGGVYSTSLAASGGVTPYRWSVISGLLPTGLALNASTGMISGTPTQAGQFALSIQASDAASPTQTATKNYTLTIANVASAAPVISNLTVSSITATSVTISWTTDIPSDTYVFWGIPDAYIGFGRDQGATDTATGTTSHSQTITGLYPSFTYNYGVRSRGFTGSVPDPAKASFLGDQATLQFRTAAPPAGSFDYYLVLQGSHHVVQGYEAYIRLENGVLAGAFPGFIKYVVSGLPPFTAVHWPDQEYNGLGGTVGTTNVLNDTLQLWGMSAGGDATQFGIFTNVGGITPPGTYTLSVTGAGPGIPSHPTPWSLTVDAIPAFPLGTPSSYPAIPNKAAWESGMITYGNKWCNSAVGGNEQSVWYYDGTRVYYQIADYTNNPSQWNPCAAQVKAAYLAYAPTMAIPGRRVFPHGFYMDYLRMADPASKTAVDNLTLNSANRHMYAYGDGWGETVGGREAAFLIGAFRLDTDLGTDRTPQLKQSVATVVDLINQSAVDGNADWHEPFMDGLLAEALIQYYEDGHQNDARIPAAIKTLADYLWTNAWQQDSTGQGFYYNSFRYQMGFNDGDMRGLNLLIAPMYAWLFRMTGNPQYQVEGDAIWTQGVAMIPTAAGWAGKEFSQNYRWSFNYVKWRSPSASRITRSASPRIARRSPNKLE